jgi:serine/threonine protein kinase
MEDPNPNSYSESESRLAELMAEIRNRIQAGEPVDLNLVEQQYPERIDEIRELLPAMQALAELGNSEDGESAASALLPEAVAPKQTLGDFRIEREIGRGGMGIVYQAEQLSLGRRVALKILPLVAVLDPKHLQRFQHEVQAAAILDHPNIVSVFSVGVDRGIHYYAMQLINGRNMADIIATFEDDSGSGKASAGRPQASQLANANEELPGKQDDTSVIANLSTQRNSSSTGFFQSVAKLGVQAANALQHAHQMGVVHRDIKPSNLLVDDAGHLWITDFGLAHLETEASLTMTGDILGTLRYMSPEQAAGNHTTLDHRGDIYALGITLYEILTGRAAFERKDRQKLLRQISDHSPPTPRSLNPRVPRDLETIVLKATEKDPNRRYQSARALAEDLERFISCVPIHARRPGTLERLTLWSKRHHRLVLSSAAAVVLVLLVTSLVTWRERQKTEAARQQLNEELMQHRRNLIGAAQSVTELAMTSYGQNITHPLVAHQIWTTVLRDAVTFYESFLSLDRPEASVEETAQAGYAYAVLGYIYNAELGDPDQSAEYLCRAVECLEESVGKKPDSLEYQLKLARSYEGLAYPLLALGKHDKSLALRRKALDIAKKLVKSHPESLTCQFQLAECFRTYGGALAAMQKPEEAIFNTREALTHYTDIRNRVGSGFWEPDFRLVPPVCISLEVIFCQRILGYHLANSNRHEEACVEYRNAIRLHDGLLPEENEFAETRAYWYVGRLYSDYANSLIALGRPDEAASVLKSYASGCTERVDSFPGLPGELRRQAIAQAELGYALFAIGNTDEAASAFQSAMDVTEKVLAKLPGMFLSERSQLVMLMANCPVPELRRAEAALALTEEMMEDRVDDPQVLQLAGLSNYRIGRYSEAIDWLEKAVSLREQPTEVDALLLYLSNERLMSDEAADLWRERALEARENHHIQTQWESVDVQVIREEAEVILSEPGK